jgi:hypothetical protein
MSGVFCLLPETVHTGEERYTLKKPKRHESATDTDKDWVVPMHDVMILNAALAAIGPIPRIAHALTRSTRERTHE